MLGGVSKGRTHAERGGRTCCCGGVGAVVARGPRLGRGAEGRLHLDGAAAGCALLALEGRGAAAAAAASVVVVVWVVCGLDDDAVVPGEVSGGRVVGRKEDGPGLLVAAQGVGLGQ